MAAGHSRFADYGTFPISPTVSDRFGDSKLHIVDLDSAIRCALLAVTIAKSSKFKT